MLSPEEELKCAALLKSGNVEARQQIVNSYVPFVALYVKRHIGNDAPLEVIYRCLQALEKAIDTFDFSKGREQFIKLFEPILRREITRYIAYS